MSKSQKLSIAEIYTLDECEKIVPGQADLAYLVINSWLNLAKDLDENVFFVLDMTIKHNGLAKTISQCDDVAQLCVTSLSRQDKRYLSPATLRGLFSLDLPITDLLQVLRYPKRACFRNEEAGDEALAQLIAVNTAVKLRDRKGYYNSLAAPYIKEFADSLHPTIRPGDPFLSSGVCADASRPYAHKVNSFVGGDRSFDYSYLIDSVDHPKHTVVSSVRSTSVPYSTQNMRRYEEVNTVFADWDVYGIDDFTVEPICVPKSLTKKRVIAPEHAWRNYGASVYFEDLVSQLRSSKLVVCDIRDQSNNQTAAYLGSISTCYASLDLSHASDSNACALVSEFFPKYSSDLMKYRQRRFKISGKTYTSYFYSTAGFVLTFPVESMVFAAIAYAATKITESFTGEQLSMPIIYGDDMLVDEKCATLAGELLEWYGFSLNLNKSFLDGRYKESCGVEYYNGIDLTTPVFPRTDFGRLDIKKLTPEQLSTIIELQHRFSRKKNINQFLCDIVRGTIPDMTFSEYGTDCSDLWAASDLVYKTRFAPHVGPVTPYTQERELHYTLVATNSGSFRKCNRACCRGITQETAYARYLTNVYEDYLQYGPMYQDKLSEILGVSTSRLNAGNLSKQSVEYKLS